MLLLGEAEADDTYLSPVLGFMFIPSFFPFSLSARTFLHFPLSLRNHWVKNDLTPEVKPSLREHDPSSVWRQGPWLLDPAWPDLAG